MELSTEMPMAGYFIYRSGEQSDPTASLEFCPPKDSDELFFALKMAYPLAKTHSERMRDAVIDFLVKERNEEQTKNQMAAPAAPMMPILSHESSAESPWSSWPSMDSNSTLSSPDLVGLATPSSLVTMSPHLNRAQPMSRQHSQAQSSTASTNTPALEQMTGVFSLSSVPQPKTRVRRKMTESEKAEYRKRRIAKACDSCSKRKRKCNHSTPQLEKVASSSKVTKPKASAVSTGAPAIRTEQLERTMFHHLEPSELSNDPFSFLDENMINELPAVDDHAWLSNTNFDDLFALKAAPQPTQNNMWPWSETPDWTLLDTPQQSSASLSPSYTNSLFPASTGLLSPNQTPLFGLDGDIPQPSHQPETGRTAPQSPTRSWRSFSDFSRTAFSTADGRDGKEMPLFHSTNVELADDTQSSSSPRPLQSTSEIPTGRKPGTTMSSVSERSTLQTPLCIEKALDCRACPDDDSSSKKNKKSSKTANNFMRHLKNDHLVTQTSTAMTDLVEHTRAPIALGASGSSGGGSNTRAETDTNAKTIDSAAPAKITGQGQLAAPAHRLPGASRSPTMKSDQGAFASLSGSSNTHSADLTVQGQLSQSPQRLSGASRSMTLGSSEVPSQSLVEARDQSLATGFSNAIPSVLRETLTRDTTSIARERPATSATATVLSTTGRSSPTKSKPTATSDQTPSSPSSSWKTSLGRQAGVPTQTNKSPVPSTDQPSTTQSSQQSTQGDWHPQTEHNPEPQREPRTSPQKSGTRMTHEHTSVTVGYPATLDTAAVATSLIMQICDAGAVVMSALLQAMLTQSHKPVSTCAAVMAENSSRASMLVGPV